MEINDLAAMLAVFLSSPDLQRIAAQRAGLERRDNSDAIDADFRDVTEEVRIV